MEHSTSFWIGSAMIIFPYVFFLIGAWECDDRDIRSLFIPLVWLLIAVYLVTH